MLTLAGPDGEAAGAARCSTARSGPGHVHGMDLWWDGDRVVFGYAKAKSDRAARGLARPRRTSYRLRRTEEPTHLFEIGIDGRDLRQLTARRVERPGPDLPAQRRHRVRLRAVRLRRCSATRYDKDETSCNLYVMRPDGSDIRRLSVNKDGDYLPHYLDDGTIGYTRWEYQERSWANIQSIWIVRPDGTGADALFKQHFNDPWALEDVPLDPRQQRELVAIAAGHHTLAAGPVVVDRRRAPGMNDPTGIRIVTPGVMPPEGGMTGTPVAEGGVLDTRRLLHDPLAAVGEDFLVSYSFDGHDYRQAPHEIDPTGYAPLPDRRVRHQGTDLPRPGHLVLHARSRCGRARGRRSCPT